MKKTSIGGEALIEGVMMRGPDDIAIAIRKSDGEIIIDKKPLQTLAKKYKIFKLPILRGAVGIFESMIIGIRSLMYSADFVDLEDDGEGEPSKLDRFLDRVFGDKIKDVVVYFSVFISLIFSVGVFFLLPYFAAKLFNLDTNIPAQRIYFNLIEGVVRVALFIAYIVLISGLKDVRRVFEYHGAEHKTIHCYENEVELTVENVKMYTTRHPRCGTAFLFVVMIISILVFSLIFTEQAWMGILLRLVLIPLVAGISYEIIKFAGRSDSWIMSVVSWPGLALQRFTTREPDDSQIEVAIAALKNVLTEDTNADKW
ncbi:MAG: DUF1385 domain-containing protein [Clostridia bacterium]|nr:DUF1385 domain-containing protein [Clostridia bacterium]